MKNVSRKNSQPSPAEQANDPLAQFEYISDISDRIDQLVEESEHCRGKDRREKLEEADRLARAYEKHCGRPNLFKKFI